MRLFSYSMSDGGMGQNLPPITLIGLDFLTCFVVSGPITIKFCTGIDHFSLNMKKDWHKINDVIILTPLSVFQNYTTLNAINSVIILEWQMAEIWQDCAVCYTDMKFC